MEEMDKIRYRPFIYTVLAFAITWACVFLLWLLTDVLSVEYKKWIVLITALDFLKSASPSIVSLVLLKRYIAKKGFLFHYFLGTKHGVFRYLLVLFIFMTTFFSVYLFRTNNDAIKISAFITTFITQIMIGGGLEEAGWRGYLLPALEKKMPVLVAVIIVGIIWASWHLIYFILPGFMQYGSNFLPYIFATILAGFILTAIYKLTDSILICIIYHGFQNTLVMTIPANQGHPGFQIIMTSLGVISIITCILIEKRGKS